MHFSGKKRHVAERKRVSVKVNSPLMLHGMLPIQFTLQCPVIFALILHPNKIISLNPHHTVATSLCDLCETVFFLPMNKRFYLHSVHIHSLLIVMAVDFKEPFHYKGNKTAGNTETQHGNHYSTKWKIIILTSSDFLWQFVEHACSEPKESEFLQVSNSDNLVTKYFPTGKFWVPWHKPYHLWFKTKYSHNSRTPLFASFALHTTDAFQASLV